MIIRDPADEFYNKRDISEVRRRYLNNGGIYMSTVYGPDRKCGIKRFRINLQIK